MVIAKPIHVGSQLPQLRDHLGVLGDVGLYGVGQ
jgi:hypothetical protein